MTEHKYEEIPELLKHTFQQVVNDSDKAIRFHTAGYTVSLEHVGDCCEIVEVEDITGDLSDLVDSPILRAEERTHVPDEAKFAYKFSASETWTFYELATIKGSVTIRFVGRSNGFYSEGVSVLVTGFLVDPKLPF